ncbi:MAG TPA: hypothetical protein VKR22_15415, partial [Acidimicrobiales bacterium]|nr:hypothetical protein [Acidimicrobiales bacterium]
MTAAEFGTSTSTLPARPSAVEDAPALSLSAPAPAVAGTGTPIPWRGAAVLGGVALAVRAAVVFAHTLTFGRTSDAADYQRLAVSLATGHGW